MHTHLLRPMPLTPDDPRYAAPPAQYQRRYDGYGPPVVAETPRDYYDRDRPPEEMSRPRNQPRDEDDDNAPLLPFPFFFGR